MTHTQKAPHLISMNKFLHMPDGSRLSLPIWFPSTFVMNEVCLEREEDRLSSVPSNPQTFYPGVAQRQEIAKRWA